MGTWYIYIYMYRVATLKKSFMDASLQEYLPNPTFPLLDLCKLMTIEHIYWRGGIESCES